MESFTVADDIELGLAIFKSTGNWDEVIIDSKIPLDTIIPDDADTIKVMDFGYRDVGKNTHRTYVHVTITGVTERD